MFIISLVNLLLIDYSIYYIHFEISGDFYKSTKNFHVWILLLLITQFITSILKSLVKTTEYFAIQNLAVPKQHTLEYFWNIKLSLNCTEDFSLGMKDLEGL